MHAQRLRRAALAATLGAAAVSLSIPPQAHAWWIRRLWPRFRSGLWPRNAGWSAADASRLRTAAGDLRSSTSLLLWVADRSLPVLPVVGRGVSLAYPSSLSSGPPAWLLPSRSVNQRHTRPGQLSRRVLAAADEDIQPFPIPGFLNTATCPDRRSAGHEEPAAGGERCPSGLGFATRLY